LRRDGRLGFTLIELLVVIAIIALLAAIIFPVMTAAKRKSYAAKCASNLKQISMCCMFYIDDNNGRFSPWVGPVTPASPQGSSWIALLQKYAKTRLLAKCPGDEAKDPTMVGYWKNVYTDYWSGQAWAPPAPLYGFFRYYNTTVYMMDGPSTTANMGIHTYWGPPRTWMGYTEKEAMKSETRHAGKANAVFLDGHVSLVGPYDWKTICVGTGASNPIPSNTPYGFPSGGWEERGDGCHPWFRGD
jgi:prepilin-type N-terminal cleavage/methylation domain-containing protein/prepilin-type processing-associated H-X9-DG protein